MTERPPEDTQTDALALEDLRIAYPQPGGARVAVDALSLRLAAGEIGCLLGSSGCGKTTVLRAIAGFEPLQAGRILLRGREIASPRESLPPERRRVGMMFQDYALFPHLDVAANVGFGLQEMPQHARAARVREMLALVGLADRTGSYPDELSGGQQQRIALARALAPAPDLLLLDEPFSNLDVDTRQRLLAESRTLLKAAGTAVLLVTHDQAEAFAMADRVGVMSGGRILQWDTPQGLYARPVDRTVAGFIGRGEWIRAETLGLGQGADVRLRPDQLRIDPEGAASDGTASDGTASDGTIEAVLESVRFHGPHVGRLRFASGEGIELDLDAATAARPGATLRLRLVGEPLQFPR
jgi:iron(III) transport system ATP-binding protein